MTMPLYGLIMNIEEVKTLAVTDNGNHDGYFLTNRPSIGIDYLKEPPVPEINIKNCVSYFKKSYITVAAGGRS
jgi:hypothetical protein